eukprot:4246511-Heterocapsa_arctica.AAC.1
MRLPRGTKYRGAHRLPRLFCKAGKRRRRWDGQSIRIPVVEMGSCTVCCGGGLAHRNRSLRWEVSNSMLPE